MSDAVFHFSDDCSFIPVCSVHWVCTIGIHGANIESGKPFTGFPLFSDIQVGDIVVFHHHGELLVKRVAAIGGMTVLLNGEEIIVPPGKLIVLGDNSENSFDSRYWEDPYIDECDVIAKVVEFQTKV